VTPTGNAGCLKKKVCNGIPNVTVWRVLLKRVHLEAYKLSIVQHLERQIDYTASSLYFRNTRHTVTFGIALQSYF
jgi:hypothetical protein